MEPLSLLEDFHKIIIKLSAMIITSILLFYLSFISFIHYDVR